jgi:hypothetical protein
MRLCALLETSDGEYHICCEQFSSFRRWSLLLSNLKLRRNLDIPSESDLGVDCLLNLCLCRVGKGQNHEIKRRSRRRPLELAALFMGAAIHLKQFRCHAGYPRKLYGCDLLRGAASLQTRGVLWHHPEVTRAGHPRSGQMGHALFIAESFGGWDGDGVTGGQQAGEECAESE